MLHAALQCRYNTVCIQQRLGPAPADQHNKRPREEVTSADRQHSASNRPAKHPRQSHQSSDEDGESVWTGTEWVPISQAGCNHSNVPNEYESGAPTMDVDSGTQYQRALHERLLEMQETGHAEMHEEEKAIQFCNARSVCDRSSVEDQQMDAEDMTGEFAGGNSSDNRVLEGSANVCNGDELSSDSADSHNGGGNKAEASSSEDPAVDSEDQSSSTSGCSEESVVDSKDPNSSASDYSASEFSGSPAAQVRTAGRVLATALKATLQRLVSFKLPRQSHQR